MTEKISAEMFLVIKVPKGWNFKERKYIRTLSVYAYLELTP